MSEVFIAKTATVGKRLKAEGKVRVGREAVVGDDVELGPGVRVGRRAKLGGDSRLMASVIIGDGVRIGRRAFILPDAKICPDKVVTHSTDARTLGDDVIIGEGVLLHNEVELGDEAIVPSQRTIASLGNFGAKNRVVTIYGSYEGPLYSVGCQVGVDYDHLASHVADATHTTAQSAGTYAPYLEVFNEIGSIVQRAFEDQSIQVAEMVAMRQELGIYS